MFSVVFLIALMCVPILGAATENVIAIQDTIERSVTELFSDTKAKDSCVIDSSLANSDQIDSLPQESGLIKLHNAEYDMLCLIAHCEGVKANAYFDPRGQKWTIAFGNTVRPDGKPVGRGDCIKDEKELMQYFNTHVEKYMFDDMDKYLPLRTMTNAEIVAMGSFLYNCGSGVLCQKNGSPSELAKAACAYFTTHSDSAKLALERLFKQKVYANGQLLPQLQKRRDLELRIMFGDILLTHDESSDLPNALNFATIALGGVYSLGRKLPKDSLDLCNKLSSMGGKNLIDSIQTQLRRPIQAIRRQIRK